MTNGPLPAGEIIERLKLERNHAPTPARRQAGEIITGRLEAHGGANYQFRRGASPSYYMTISSVRGPETFWGVDLERALKESQSQPKIGSQVGLQRVGSEPVTLPANDGGRTADREQTFRRTRWRVEGVEFLAQSIEHARRGREAQLADKRALRERPELRSAFISLQIAQRFADRSIHDPRDRELFVERVRALMAASIEGVPPRRVHTRDEPTR